MCGIDTFISLVFMWWKFCVQHIIAKLMHSDVVEWNFDVWKELFRSNRKCSRNTEKCSREWSNVLSHAGIVFTIVFDDRPLLRMLYLIALMMSLFPLSNTEHLVLSRSRGKSLFIYISSEMLSTIKMKRFRWDSHV